MLLSEDNLKKLIFALSAAILMIIGLLYGCSAAEVKGNAVVCAAFPQYDLARRICGDCIDVIMLLPCGSEAHDFEPSAKDIKTVAASSLFIYNGGESDSWIDRVLEGAGDVNAVSLIDCCTSPLYVDGEDGREQDEHIWTSPKNALIMAEKIYKSLTAVYPDKAESLESNYNSLVTSLKELDAECAALSESLKGRTVIIGDRNPFGYFARDYGISMASAFHGCGHDSEPSAAELKELINTAKADGAKKVFYVDFSGGKIARTVAEELDAEVLHLNSCHNVTPEDFKNKSYCDLMRDNIKALSGVCNAAD